MSFETYYKSPEADLSADAERVRKTRDLYDAQNGIAGVVVGAAVSLLMAILWSEASTSNQYISLAFFVLTGVTVGGAFRYAARAVTRSMRYAALTFQLASCVLAIVFFAVPIVAREATPFLIVVMLLATGAVAAFVFSHRSLTDEQKGLVWRQEKAPEVLTMRLRNRGWVIFCASVLGLLSIMILAVVWIVHLPLSYE